MNTKILIYIIIYSSFSFSCNTRKRDIQKNINHWYHKEILFPESLENIQQDSLWKTWTKQKKYKILTCVDTNDCTECKLNLYDWKRIIAQTDSIRDTVTFLFIIHPQNISKIERMKQKNKFEHPIFYDTLNKMEKLNHFPKNNTFRTFLLDKNNHVILVGNPIGNKTLWNLYKQIITREIKENENSYK